MQLGKRDFDNIVLQCVLVISFIILRKMDVSSYTLNCFSEVMFYIATGQGLHRQTYSTPYNLMSSERAVHWPWQTMKRSLQTEHHIDTLTTVILENSFPLVYKSSFYSMPDTSSLHKPTLRK